MCEKYDICITNPPYMGNKGINIKLGNVIKLNYPNSKMDLCVAFIERCIKFTKKNKYIAMITMHSWMFLGSFEKFRKNLIKEKYICNLVHLGTKGFDDINGEVVQTVSFVLKNNFINKKGSYLRLVKYDTSKLKNQQFFNLNNRYIIKQSIFDNIPMNVIGYWLNSNLLDAFKSNTIGSVSDVVKGLDTCDNDRFVRLWFEIDFYKIGLGITSNKETYNNKWFPYAKGGEFRKWYGNNNNIVMWENYGVILRSLKTSDGKQKSRPQNTRYYFKEGITWSSINGSTLALRYMNNSIFGGGGSALFLEDDLYYILGILNSKVSSNIINILNPTLNVLVTDIKNIPLRKDSNLLENVLS